MTNIPFAPTFAPTVSGPSPLNPGTSPSPYSGTSDSTRIVGETNAPGLFGGLINIFKSGNPSGAFSPTTNFPNYNTPISTPSVPQTITSPSVKTNTPATLPPAPTTNTTQGSLSATSNSYMTPPPNTSLNDNGIATYTPPPPVTPTADTTSPSVRDAILSKLADLNTSVGTKTATTNDLNTQFGVDQKQQNYIDAYNQYQTKKLQYDQQIQSIYDTPGITREQAQQQVNEASRINNADLANLAVIATAAQGNYQGALDIVKRKIDAEFDPMQQQIDNLGKYAQLNNADLTDSEKVTLENKRFQLQNNLDQLKSAKLSAHQFALQQGITDPTVLNAIDAAQTPADAYAAIGGTNGQLPSGNGETSNINPQYGFYTTRTQNGTQYVSQDKLANLTPFQQQDAARQYAAAGIPVLNTEQTNKIQSIDVTQQNLAGLQDVINGKDIATGNQGSPLLGTGVLGRAGSAVSNYIADKTQSNPNIAAFNNYRLTAINTLQSLGAGSGGSRITASEIATAVSNLPTLTDNMETAKAKLNIVNGFLTKWTNELLPQKTSNGSSGNNSGGTGITNSKGSVVSASF